MIKKGRVSVFSAQKFVKKYFDDANKRLKTGLNLDFIDVQLDAKTAQLASGSEAVCAFVNDSLNAEVLQKLNDFKINHIAMRCAGFNNIDQKVAKELNFKISRVPAYSPEAVAEHSVALMLALNRKLKKAIDRVRDSNFDIEGLMGWNIHKKTVGIIGMGNIGFSLARIMKGFGANVLGHDVYQNPEAIKLGVKFVDLDTIYRESDIISLHCPMKKENYHMINEESIGKMKENVMLINTSRGALIDNVAAIRGLKTKKVGYLGLDVYENEDLFFFEDLSDSFVKDDDFGRLLAFNNVIITPHIAFLTEEAVNGIAETTLHNLKQCLNNEKCENLLF
jgi:D-lactate dehydrogenase